MTILPGNKYEFDDAQNATFARLGGAMMFVAVAMLLLSATVGGAALMLAQSSLAASAILAPVGIAVAVMGAQLFAAARRFRRIVTTSGSDIANLMAALDDMAVAYGVQRWLWMTALVAIIVALAFTIVGR